jgi:uncharacterized repeat protein (TIGR01451 family)
MKDEMAMIERKERVMKIRPMLISFILGLELALALLWLMNEATLLVAQAVVQQSPVQRPRLQAGNVITVCPAVAGTCPYTNVQAAVDAANGGDVIKVAAGVYTSVNVRPRRDLMSTGVVTQLVYISKTVTIQGGYTVGDWTTPHPKVNTTRLDAQEQGRVLYVTGDISPTIEGLYITGGDATGLGGATHWGEDAGGGVYIITATATMSNNRVLDNTADCGGGMYLHSSDAIIKGNTIARNTANYCGGGVELDESAAIFSGNTITANVADDIGGGINLSGSSARLVGNSIVSNTAYYGGGLQMAASEATLIGNTFTLNTATYGGGLFDLNYSITLDGNTFMSNTASREGGGLLIHHSEALLVNNLVADNQSHERGNGLWIMGSSARILHNTIAHNKGADGGISVIDEPSEEGPIPSNVAMTNTILVGHAVGISVSGGSTVTVNGVLWHNTPITVFQAATATAMVQHQVEGDPAFVDPDAGNYHLGPASAAIDKGVDAGTTTDIDGESRPVGTGHDIGADEFPAALSVTKRANPGLAQAGVQLTYTIHVTNTGHVTLTATITDVLPDHVTATQSLIWTSQVITAPGGVWTKQFTVAVEAGYSEPLTNVVQVTTEEGIAGVYTETTHGAGMTTTVDPDLGGVLVYTDTQGLPTIIWVPASAVTETITLAYAPLLSLTRPLSPGLRSANHAFDLKIYRDDTHLPSFAFKEPLTVTIRYSNRDVGGIFEHSLALYRWHDNKWKKVAYPPFWSETQQESCQLDAQTNELTCVLWKSSIFEAMGASGYKLYLPIVMKDNVMMPW